MGEEADYLDETIGVDWLASRWFEDNERERGNYIKPKQKYIKRRTHCAVCGTFIKEWSQKFGEKKVKMVCGKCK